MSKILLASIFVLASYIPCNAQKTLVIVNWDTCGIEISSSHFGDSNIYIAPKKGVTVTTDTAFLYMSIHVNSIRKGPAAIGLYDELKMRRDRGKHGYRIIITWDEWRKCYYAMFGNYDKKPNLQQ